VVIVPHARNRIVEKGGGRTDTLHLFLSGSSSIIRVESGKQHFMSVLPGMKDYPEMKYVFVDLTSKP